MKTTQDKQGRTSPRARIITRDERIRALKTSTGYALVMHV